MDAVRVDSARLQQFVRDILLSSGVDAREAPIIAKIFVWFDLIGRSTQGVGRLSDYLVRLRQGLIASPCNPSVAQKSPTICAMDGHNGFGQYLGHVAMSRAIDIAGEYGIGMVGVRHSNHFGAGAYYVQLAAERPCIGLTFSNGFPRVAPYGGVATVLGTNPFAFGVPVRSGRSVLVDFSTGASSGSAIRRAAKDDGKLPEGIAVDGRGGDVLDAKLAVHNAILPFGGAKGYCVGLMVEIMAGVVTGSGISHEVGSMYHNFERASNAGHAFLAIDVAKMMPLVEFYDRMDRLIDLVKSTPTASSVDEILIPGEKRWRNYETQLAQGIDLNARDADALAALAKELDLCPPW